MKISIFCKASEKIGLGHLIRSSAFADQVANFNDKVRIFFYLVGDESLSKLITNSNNKITCLKDEIDITDKVSKVFDVAIIDMLTMNKNVLLHIKKKSKKIAVISPIFNNLNLVDYYFNRTKYINFNASDYPNLKVYAGLEYAIINSNCQRINSGIYEETLNSKNFPIAISMGGGDAGNRTLEVLKALKKCNVHGTFWVMIGEKYNHSIDALINRIRSDTSHEIILAKTNKSMWSILKNCALVILPGGITTYEAVYAGLPSINFFEEKGQEFLIKELEEKKALYNIGLYSKQTLNNLIGLIENLYHNKKKLLQIHFNSKFLIDGKASLRIFKLLSE
jgi:spore coat polysaccharide biosynthesis predicted glycosyltransferase SpsG